jgi:enoyl-CoA hydratase/carnithine racemase
VKVAEVTEPSSGVQVAEQDGVLTIRAAAPVGCGPAVEQIAAALLDTASDLTERLEPLAAVVLDCPQAFFVLPPESQADLDAVPMQWRAAVAAVARLAQPTIAVVRGAAVGPAWDLALGCDLRVAVDSATLGSPELRWGRLPTAGAGQRLARLGGPGLALRLLLLGELLRADEAQALGLLAHVEPADTIDQGVAALCATLRSSAPIALAYAKETVTQADQLPLADGLRLEADLAALLQTTDDRRTGLQAFLTRSTAHFDGR